MMRGRIAFQSKRLFAVVGSATLSLWVLMPGTSAAFSAASLSGAYGCSGHVETGNSSAGFLGMSELLRLGFDGAGTVHAKIILNLEGEVCTVTGTGTYTVAGGGLGSMNIPWTTVTGDEDGDVPCPSLETDEFTQHTDIVLETGGSAFDFQDQDDFLTTPKSPGDNDSGSRFVGNCKKQ
jgi:hypothetical protein